VAVQTGKEENHIPTEGEEAKDFIFLNVQKQRMKILFSKIIYIESQRE